MAKSVSATPKKSSLPNSRSSSSSNLPETPSSTPSTVKSSSPFLLSKIWSGYSNTTPQNLMLIDAYLVFVLVTGIVQFLYVLIVGDYPMNAFLSGFIVSVGNFVLAANLRIQSNPKNADDLHAISPERAYADFAFASLILFGFSVNFIG